MDEVALYSFMLQVSLFVIELQLANWRHENLESKVIVHVRMIRTVSELS